MALEAVMHGMSEASMHDRRLLSIASTRIRDLANNLLSQAREVRLAEDQSEKLKKSLHSFSIKKAIEEIIEEKRTIFPNIQIQLMGELDGQVIGDRFDFQRVISNLFNNSIESLKTDLNGIVEVYLRKYGNKYGVHINDNGVGIPAEVINRIGEQGFSFNKEQGNGLGVSYAKAKMIEWGGSFQISSRENVGTMVTLTFASA
jgi:signal transduction histidine kinase